MEGNDMPITELPEHYSVDSERLGMALAHVSAQTNRLTEVHASLTTRQAEQEAQQMKFVEERVAEARLEAESRTQALVCAINQAYGDPTSLEQRVADRIQGVLVALQEPSLEQARALAEAQLTNQDAAYRELEGQIREELLVVQAQAALRAEKSIEAAMMKMSSEHQQVLQQQTTAELERQQLHSRMGNLDRNYPQYIDIAVAKAQKLAVSESDSRLTQSLADLEDCIVRQVESQIIQTVRGMMEKWQKAFQQQNLKLQMHLEEKFAEHLDERLRGAIVVAKKATEAKTRDVVRATIAKPSLSAPSCSAIVADNTTQPPNILARVRLQAQKEVTDRARGRAMELKAATSLIFVSEQKPKRCLRWNAASMKTKRKDKTTSVNGD